MKSRLCAVLLLVVASAAGQLAAGEMGRPVRGRVAFGNGVCELSAHVTVAGRGGPMAVGDTNDQCEVDFFNLPEGHYRLTVSGDHVANADAGDIDVMSDGPDEFEVQVTRPKEIIRNEGMFGNALVSAADLSVPSRARKELDKANELAGKQKWEQAIHELNKAITIERMFGNPLVSAADLSVPSRARKELDKANELAGKQKWEQAIHELNKAITIDPAYAVAYNNLGVIYSHLGDHGREVE